MFSSGLFCGKDLERRDGLEGPMLSPDINSEMSMVMNCSGEFSFGTIANVICPSSSESVVEKEYVWMVQEFRGSTAKTERILEV